MEELYTGECELLTDEEKQAEHEKDLKRIENFTLMDDDFMRAFFKDNIDDTEYVLRIILDKPGLVVKSVKTQDDMKNLRGRSATLDVHAIEEDGTEEDIEVQRADKGAGSKRARHNSALLDASILKSGQDPEELPDTYVIFITEKDVIKQGQPIYIINRHVELNGGYIPFDDGEHIIYVNGAWDDVSTELGKLMHDFRCKKADDMYNTQLAKQMRYLKESEEGVSSMCREIEKMRNEVAEKVEKRVEKRTDMRAVARLIRNGKLSIEEIADCYPSLTMDEIRAIEKNIMQTA